MQQFTIRIATTLTAMILGFSATTMAFSFNLGPSTPDSRLPKTHTTNGADVPTPQFFQVTLGQPPAPADLSFEPAKPVQMRPTMDLQNSQRQESATSAPVAQQPASQVSPSTTAQQLSGPELYLLRNVNNVAKQP